MNVNNAFRTKRITVSGILLALVVIVLYFESIMPTNRLALYALSSFFVSVIIIEFGIKSGWLFYAASAIMALIIIPDKIGLTPYMIFFGIYGIIKFYIEKLDKLPYEYVLKMLFFNACMVTAIILVKEIFIESVKINFPWWIVILLFEFVFVIYDYVYSLFIQYYKNRVKKILGL